jgi:hypothetical protein
VAVLSPEDFDALEFEAARSGDHRSAARVMARLASTGTQTTAMPRAEAYLRAGEQWLLAGEPATAVLQFRRALQDGGPVSADPRIPLARALFMLGQAAEAQALLGQLSAEPPRDPRGCDLVAELLAERSDLPGALAWATAGVELCLRRAPGPVAARLAAQDSTAQDSTAQVPAAAFRAGAGAMAPADEAELRLLLSLRFRIRNDLGLPEDGYDRLLDELPPGRAGTG